MPNQLNVANVSLASDPKQIVIWPRLKTFLLWKAHFTHDVSMVLSGFSFDLYDISQRKIKVP